MNQTYARIPVVAVVGHRNSGKTTVIESIVRMHAFWAWSRRLKGIIVKGNEKIHIKISGLTSNRIEVFTPSQGI